MAELYIPLEIRSLTAIYSTTLHRPRANITAQSSEQHDNEIHNNYGIVSTKYGVLGCVIIKIPEGTFRLHMRFFLFRFVDIPAHHLYVIDDLD